MHFSPLEIPDSSEIGLSSFYLFRTTFGELKNDDGTKVPEILLDFLAGPTRME